MEIITIPEYFGNSKSSHINLQDYQSNKDFSKHLINLTKNLFSFLIEGKKDIITTNSTLSINNSNFLLIRSGNCIMTERVSVDRSYRSILLFFSNEEISRLIRKLGTKPINKTQPQTVFSIQYDMFTRNFAKSLIEISKLSANMQRKLLEVKFEEIILYLIETKGSEFLGSFATNNGHQNQSFIDTVENNKFKKLSLKELAFLCNMSISSFKREFEKHYDKPPIKWFQDKRLEYASYLLKQEGKRASDIYSEIGYENLSSFIQAFKSKYGVTPKQH